MIKTALIVDDEPDIRELLSLTLTQLNLKVDEASNLAEAYRALKEHMYDFCLTDMRLPDGDGLQLIEHVQATYPDLPIAMITAHGNTDIAVEALKKGAFDFVTKPVQLPRLRAMVQTALELSSDKLSEPGRPELLVGNSQQMQTLRQQISRVARSQAPIFISGKSGSGKELVARAIHYQGPRGKGPFIPVNCGAIPSELMESEFFGHKKGSFTGAFQDKQGLFQAANGGTLFLDEVADLPLHMQVKLLRAIQEKSVRPIGEERETQIDVRILSATHKNLTREVSAGNFREDLFYRINVIEITVPGLSEHAQDIPELATLFLERLAQREGIAIPKLAPSALAAMERYSFPGNVRELENMLERAMALFDGKEISAHDLQLVDPEESDLRSVSPEPATETAAPEKYVTPASSLDEHMADIEKTILQKTLEETRWNRTAAAKKLGISFRQLRYKLKKLGIE